MSSLTTGLEAAIDNQPTMMNRIDSFADTWIAGHATLALAGLVLMALWIIYLLAKKSESLANPTSTLRMTDGDQWGLGNREFLDSGAAVQPSAAAAAVLASADFDCANRKPVGDDAWSWQDAVAHEQLRGDRAGEKPTTDRDFSKILAGY